MDNLKQKQPAYLTYRGLDMSAEMQISTNSDATINTLEFDAVLAENHSFSSELTEFPVDGLSTVSDHVIQKPDVFSMQVFVSDYGYNYDNVMLAFESLSAGEGIVSSHNAFNTFALLRNLKIGMVPLSIYTNYATYENMLITGIRPSIGVNDSSSIVFDLSFKQIMLVDLEVVETTVFLLTRPKGKNLDKATSKRVRSRRGHGITKMDTKAIQELEKAIDAFKKNNGEVPSKSELRATLAKLGWIS